MQHGIQRGALNPNKGLNTRKYMAALLAGLVFIILAIGAWLLHERHAAGPGLENNNAPAGDGRTATQKGGNTP